MARFKQYPVFYSLIGFAGLLLIVEGMFLVIGQDALESIHGVLRDEEQKKEILERRMPSPTAENLEVARADLQQNVSALQEMLRSLNVDGSNTLDLFRHPPLSRTDAYFDIATFVERNRELAEKFGVEIRPEERFSFSAYTNEGPEQEYVIPIYKQRKVADHILEALFIAKPRQILWVKREDWEIVNPGEKVSRFQPKIEIRGRSGGDIFTINPEVTARMAGVVDTIAFQISFVGQTSSLRIFMNLMADSELPLVVRSVEVESLVKAKADERHGRGRRSRSRNVVLEAEEISGSLLSLESAKIPIVKENFSHFTVTIEFLEIKFNLPEIEQVEES
ncbi:MAG: Amuc_1100 family pilus-like protein [Opitutaceae bacterium]|nr:Amuc_1100 family pilus-like protein [Opitutaceae bacterium]